ncbi:MAG: hypothetical protein DWQ07_24800 [Chloroflexi bacterium]|nr:MAG: hypothetical protein DWQ07_24800 [Chloroflexota bacterium]MBL1197088.1 hypothetical protein [Chloroflexota bacterium]
MQAAATEATQKPQGSRLFDHIVGTRPSAFSVSHLMAILFPDPAENAARTAHLFRQHAFLPQHRGSLAFLNLV